MENDISNNNIKIENEKNNRLINISNLDNFSENSNQRSKDKKIIKEKRDIDKIEYNNKKKEISKKKEEHKNIIDKQKINRRNRAINVKINEDNNYSKNTYDKII